MSTITKLRFEILSNFCFILHTCVLRVNVTESDWFWVFTFPVCRRVYQHTKQSIWIFFETPTLFPTAICQLALSPKKDQQWFLKGPVCNIWWRLAVRKHIANDVNFNHCFLMYYLISHLSYTRCVVRVKSLEILSRSMFCATVGTWWHNIGVYCMLCGSLQSYISLH